MIAEQLHGSKGNYWSLGVRRSFLWRFPLVNTVSEWRDVPRNLGISLSLSSALRFNRLKQNRHSAMIGILDGLETITYSLCKLMACRGSSFFMVRFAFQLQL